jgi:predicted nucleic acid-binding protein
LIFVDTGAFFALAVARDPNHARAVAWMRGNAEQLLTIDI